MKGHKNYRHFSRIIRIGAIAILIFIAVVLIGGTIAARFGGV